MLLGEFDEEIGARPSPGVVVDVGRMNELRRLLVQDLGDLREEDAETLVLELWKLRWDCWMKGGYLRVCVSEGVDGNASREVEVLAVLRIPDLAAFASSEDDWGTRVGREETLALLLEELGDIRRRGTVRVRGGDVRAIGLR